VKNKMHQLIFVTVGNACYSGGVPKWKSRYQLFKTDLNNQYLAQKPAKTLKKEIAEANEKINKQQIDDGTPEDPPPAELCLSGMTIYIHGTYSRHEAKDRATLESLIEQHGGLVATTVSNAVTLALAPTDQRNFSVNSSLVSILNNNIPLVSCKYILDLCNNQTNRSNDAAAKYLCQLPQSDKLAGLNNKMSNRLIANRFNAQQYEELLSNFVEDELAEEDAKLEPLLKKQSGGANIIPIEKYFQEYPKHYQWAKRRGEVQTYFKNAGGYQINILLELPHSQHPSNIIELFDSDKRLVIRVGSKNLSTIFKRDANKICTTLEMMKKAK